MIDAMEEGDIGMVLQNHPRPASGNEADLRLRVGTSKDGENRCGDDNVPDMRAVEDEDALRGSPVWQRPVEEMGT